MVGWLEFNVPFQHKYGYIRDESCCERLSREQVHLLNIARMELQTKSTAILTTRSRSPKTVNKMSSLPTFLHILITLPAGSDVKYCDEYICLWVCLCVCLSVREDISRTTVAIFIKFLCLCPWLGSPPTCLRQAASPIAGKGFSSSLKMHYRPGKGVEVHSTGKVCYLLLPCLFLLLSADIHIYNYTDECIVYVIPCR